MTGRYLSPLAALPLALIVTGCDAAPDGPADTEAGAATPDAGSGPSPSATLAPAPSPGDSAPAARSDDGVNDGYPDLTPAPSTPEAERTETGARNVLLAFARAIELQEWDQAWAMLGEADRARWSKAQFAALFRDLDDVMVAVPSGTMEGAAGSSYYTAPTTITGTDQDGRPVRFEGEIVLKRSNDVPGATAEQLRWRIDRVDLDWTH